MIKQSLFVSFLLLNCIISYSQIQCPPVYGDNSTRRFHITGGVGFTRLYGDIDNPGTAGLGVYGRLDYTIIRGLHIGGEGQLGSLEAVANPPFDPREVSGRYFNLGLSISVHPFDLSPGKQVRNYSFGERLARGFYLGVGAGFIRNFHGANNYRDLGNPATFGPPASDDVLADPRFRSSTSSLLLPVLNAGFAVPLTNDTFRSRGYWSAVLNAQFNFSNNDDMDGYVPLRADGSQLSTANDYYCFYSLGARYSF